MTSAIPRPTADEQETGRKEVWVEPIVTRFDVGDAEASDGPGPDGGLAS